MSCVQSDKKQLFDQSAADFEQSLVELRECADGLASRFGSIGTLLAELEETLASPDLAQLTQQDSGKTIKQIVDELQAYVDAFNKTSSDMVSKHSFSLKFNLFSSQLKILF